MKKWTLALITALVLMIALTPLASASGIDLSGLESLLGKKQETAANVTVVIQGKDGSVLPIVFHFGPQPGLGEMPLDMALVKFFHSRNQGRVGGGDDPVHETSPYISQKAVMSYCLAESSNQK